MPDHDLPHAAVDLSRGLLDPRKNGCSRGSTMKTRAITATSTAETIEHEQPVQPEEHGEEEHEHAEGVRDVHDPRAQERAHIVQVIRGAGDEVTRLVGLEEGVVELQEPVVDPLPQAVLDRCARRR